jgi:hypothetical protein
MVLTVTPGRTATLIGALSVLGVGVGVWCWPQASTRSYGIPHDDPDTHAYVRAVAARDLVIGAFVLWAAVVNDRPAMEAGLLTSALAPIADLLLVAERRGMMPQLAIHGIGVVGAFSAWALVRSETP